MVLKFSCAPEPQTVSSLQPTASGFIKMNVLERLQRKVAWADRDTTENPEHSNRHEETMQVFKIQERLVMSG